MNPISKILRQIKKIKDTLLGFIRRTKLKTVMGIYFHNDRDFEFIPCKFDREGRYLNPSQISEEKKVITLLRCLNNNKVYALLSRKLPYTVDFSHLMKTSMDDGDILDDIGWDIHRQVMYDVAVTKTDKMDLIWMGLLCLALGCIIGMKLL